MDSVYSSMLKELGYAVEEPLEELQPCQQEYIPRCCGEIVYSNHEVTCSACGRVLQDRIPVNPVLYAYASDGQRLNHGYTYVFRRPYKIEIHFYTHLKLYMGILPCTRTTSRYSRANWRLLKQLGSEPEDDREFHNGEHDSILEQPVVKSLIIDTKDTQAYHTIRQQLKLNRAPHMYRNVWYILYRRGGVYRTVTQAQMIRLRRHFECIEHFFHHVHQHPRRHNIKSVPMLLEMLLHYVGHRPYYDFPKLKNVLLRQEAVDFFDEYMRYLHDRGGEGPAE